MRHERVRDIAVLAARRAEAAIQQHHSPDLRRADSTDEKDGLNDIVTECDRRAQEVIIDTIEEYFPDDAVLAEEDGGDREGSSGRTWVIDPIDGTVNFSVGLHYSTSIGVREDGETVVGVVHSPRQALNRTWAAVRGEGAHATRHGDVGWEPISVTDHAEIDKALLIQTGHHSYPTFDEIGARPNIRQTGSCAISHALVAEGRVDGFLSRLALEPWDVEAGGLLVREAGGRARRVPDETLPILASNGTDLHEALDEELTAYWAGE